MRDTFWLQNTVLERDTIYKTNDTTIYVETIKTVNTTPEKKPNNLLGYLRVGSTILLIMLVLGFFIGLKLRK